MKEHALLIDLQQPNKSEVHSNAAAINSTTYSRIQKSYYLDHLIRKAIRVDLHPNNVNRKAGLVCIRS